MNDRQHQQQLRALTRIVSRLTIPDVRQKTHVAIMLRALLLIEWTPMRDDEGFADKRGRRSCDACAYIRPKDRLTRSARHVAHSDRCVVDAALNAAGLSTQGERDKQRGRIP